MITLARTAHDHGVTLFDAVEAMARLRSNESSAKRLPPSVIR